MKPRNDYHVRITVNGKSVRVAYYTTTDEASLLAYAQNHLIARRVKRAGSNRQSLDAH